MKKPAVLLFLLLFALTGAAQGPLKKGDHYFKHGRYAQALQAYKKAVDKKSDVPKRAHVRVAICHRQRKQYEDAGKAYGKLYEKDMLSGDQLLNYGHILRNLERYKKAKKIYQEFADQNADDPRGYYYKEAANWALEHQKKNPAHKVKELGVETGGLSLGQFPYKNGIFYSKTRKVETENGEIRTADLVFAEKSNGSFGKAQELDGNINTRAIQGSPSLLEKENGKDTLYYTSNIENVSEINARKKEDYGIKEQDGVNTNILRIMVAEKKDDREWERQQVLHFGFDKNLSHPHITSSGDSLFFISDEPGGQGKNDIYLVTKEDTGWGEAKNLGETVNTREHESQPFYRNGTLYFSSKGHFNYGGSDIFKCKWDPEKEKWGSVENMGKPLNSPQDDYAFVLTSDPDSGFFSSNRNTDPGKDRIFSFKNLQLPDTIRGIARNRINSQPISDVKVTLFHDGETVSEQITNETGKCKLILEQDTKYRVRFKKEGYEKKEYDIPKDEREDVIALLNSIELDPKPTKDKVVELDNIYFDYGKAELRPDGKETLDKLHGYMKDHPKARIELSAHTDAQSSADFNMKLSRRRARSCYEYLKQKGLSEDRMKPKGYGETQLVNECSDGVECSDEKHQENRRVEIKFLKKKGSS
ncbi:MAG: OmpA family protein [Flavobacteriales bacterium]